MIIPLMPPILLQQPPVMGPPNPQKSGAQPVWPKLSQDTLHLNIPKGLPNLPVLAEIPASQNVEMARHYRSLREQAALQLWLDKPLEDWQGWKFDQEKGRRDPGGPAKGDLPNRANVLLSLGKDLERVNQVLLSGKPYSGVGTHFALKQAPFIARNGDYDFSAMAMTTLLYTHWDNPALKPETKKHIATVLLNQEGNQHLKPRWLLGIIPETENHILMTESSRYLKNQIVHKHGLGYSTSQLPAAAYDNQKNGFKDWFTNHLSTFLRHDFDEYNSRPYQGYTVKSIQNLYEFADDPKVKKSAQIVMDYLSTRFAIQSSDLRRVVPFRRRFGHQNSDNILTRDSESARHAVLAGNFQGAFGDPKSPQPFGRHNMFPGTFSYTPPDLVMDLMVNKGNNPYFAMTRHENTEIVYAEENFSLSAGGHFHKWSNLPFSKVENGIPMPTVVMLKNGGPLLSNMLRFLGRGDSDKVNNTGVYENFAFGIRPTVPETWKAQLTSQGKWLEEGPWTFIQQGEAYLALHTQSQKSPKNYAPSVGFVEVVDAREFPSLLAFKQAVLARNPHTFGYYGSNQYLTTRGKVIDFVMADPLVRGQAPQPQEITHWSVKRVWQNGRLLPIETDLRKWPLMNSSTLKPENDGQNNNYVVKADGTGQILVNNPRRNQGLILSLADPQNPIRIETRGEIVNLSETARHGAFRYDKNGVDIEIDLAQAHRVRYASLKWAKGSAPQNLKVLVQYAGHLGWHLAEDRTQVFRSQDHDFRSDIDLTLEPYVKKLRFIATGKDLNLRGYPEIYQV